MWIVCITSVRHVLTVNGYGGRQTKENEKSWCFKGWETLVINSILTILKAAKIHHFSKLTVNTQYFLHKDTKKESDIGALHHKNNLSVIIK